MSAFDHIVIHFPHTVKKVYNAKEQEIIIKYLAEILCIVVIGTGGRSTNFSSTDISCQMAMLPVIKL